MKKLRTLLFTILLLCAFAVHVSAAIGNSGEIALPNWQYMSSISIRLDFTEEKEGIADVTVTRINNVTTSLSGTLTVYKMVGIDWVYVGSVSDTTDISLALEYRFDGVSGTMYKAVADITAYSANGSESESVKKITTCP